MSPYSLTTSTNVAPVSDAPLMNPNIFSYSSCLYSNGTVFPDSYQDPCSSTATLANILPTKANPDDLLEASKGHNLLIVNPLAHLSSNVTVL